VKASLVGCAVAVAALTAILALAAVALGENRTYAQPAGVSTAAVTSDSDAAGAPAALERLARAKFGELSEAEMKLAHAAPSRALLWIGPNADADSPDNDPTHAAKWPPTRAIRARSSYGSLPTRRPAPMFIQAASASAVRSSRAGLTYPT
jgi:hypothetical protein